MCINTVMMTIISLPFLLVIGCDMLDVVVIVDVTVVRCVGICNTSSARNGVVISILSSPSYINKLYTYLYIIFMILIEFM